MKILIAEDDRNYAMLLKDVVRLQFKTADIWLAFDGEDATRKYVTWHPDAVITDYYMPRMKGDELASFIRQKDKDATIILLSSTFLDIQERHLFTAVFDKKDYNAAIQFLSDRMMMDKYLCPSCAFLGPHTRKLHCWICGKCRYVLKKPL